MNAMTIHRAPATANDNENGEQRMNEWAKQQQKKTKDKYRSRSDVVI